MTGQNLPRPADNVNIKHSMPIEASKILLIEDESDLQKMYGLAFAKTGYSLLQARDGATGLQIAKDNHPDLILLDIFMPGMDGLEVLKHLKADPVLAKIPVVMLTNYTREDTLKKALALGARDVIIKTDIVPRELVDRIKNKYLAS